MGLAEAARRARLRASGTEFDGISTSGNSLPTPTHPHFRPQTAKDPPDYLSEVDANLWELALEAMSDGEVMALLRNSLEPLEKVFNHYAMEGPSGLNIPVGGIGLILKQFDVLPTFVSKKDVKRMYQIVVHLYDVPDEEGLDFTGVVHLLVLVAVSSLSKRQFSRVYPTYGSKVDVLLKSWGLADTLKLEMVSAYRH